MFSRSDEQFFAADPYTYHISWRRFWNLEFGIGNSGACPEWMGD